MSFGKLFESTFSGSMVGQGATMYAVWAYVIAHAKPPGIVEINPVLLAAIIGDSVESIEAALEKLQAPDEMSRSKEHEGRRLIREGQFLFVVPTFAKYRNARNDDERKAYNAKAQRESRTRRKSNKVSMTVNDCQHPSAQAEAEAEAEAEASHHLPQKSTPPPVERERARWFPESLRSKAFRAAWERWEDHCRESGKTLHESSRRSQLQRCVQHGESRTMSVIAGCIERNWKSLVWDFDARIVGANGEKPVRGRL